MIWFGTLFGLNRAARGPNSVVCEKGGLSPFSCHSVDVDQPSMSAIYEKDKHISSKDMLNETCSLALKRLGIVHYCPGKCKVN